MSGVGIDEVVFEEYQTYLFSSNKTPSELSQEEMALAKELGEKRKNFLKTKAKELGLSAQKFEKDLTKMLKKVVTAKNKESKIAETEANDKKPVTSKKIIDGEEAIEDDENPIAGEENASTTLDRELLPPEENVGRGGYYVNSPQILAAHLKATSGRWKTRFPPEPNGYLHIGHAKAMFVSFGVAKRHGGTTMMRFDDTNPEAEKMEYINSILRNVSWLGHEYEALTHTSDYFEELYNLGVELIKRGKAYVCEQPQEDVKRSREILGEWHKRFKEKCEAEGKLELLEVIEQREDPDLFRALPAEAISPFRDRSVEENVRLFSDMRKGLFDEGEATLRMKQNLLSPNPNLWDQMAYRVIYKEHPKTGDKWCIYPTYDYSHCLVDSLENITHSLCSLEFESRQSKWGSYHWLVEMLGMYHAQTWEFSRCSISCNVMSKRRLKKLVDEKYVSGWDDPRLLTLDGLKRRGYTASAINAFCEAIGVARSSNTVCIKHSLVEHFIRKDLNDSAPRKFAILSPVKLIIKNFTAALKANAFDQFAEVPNFPQDPVLGSRSIEVFETCYIPMQKVRSDEEIALIGKKGYKGLIKGNYARLLYGPKLKCIDYKLGSDGVSVSEVVCVAVSLEELEAEGIKENSLATIAWVSLASEKDYAAQTVEARLYDKLFTNCEVEGVEVHAEKAAKDQGKDFLELLNPESLEVSTALVEKSVMKDVQDYLIKKAEAEAKMALVEDMPTKVALDVDIPRWQFSTVGYFCVDLDSTSNNIVVNRVCSLKESKTLRR